MTSLMIKNFLAIILLLFFCCDSFSQQSDSANQAATRPAVTITPDTFHTPKDTLAAVHPFMRSYQLIIDSILNKNKFINLHQPPVYFVATDKKKDGKEFIFYSLCTILLIFGIFRTFYNSYYQNLFRVFFNTSIRQTQLTDQLLQAGLPSFILNIFFAVSIGFYLWLLFKNFHTPLRHISNELLLPVCIAGAGMLYFVKYVVLKFVGWMSGASEATDSYIFVIFLVNKIAGIVLLPFIILLAFSSAPWNSYITIFSVLTLGLLLLSRYIKAFSFLEHRFPMEPLHFIIYVVAMEVLPIMMLYKMIIDYIIK